MSATPAVGSRYGSLELLEHIEPPRFIRKREKWARFRCDCGKEKNMRVSAVVNGNSRSCGCAAQRGMRGWLQGHRAQLIAEAGVRRPLYGRR